MTTEFGRDPTLHSYALIVRRRKWWVAGLALAGLTVSLALSFAEPSEYTATAQVLVQQASDNGALGSTQQTVTPTQVQTILLLVTSTPVRQAVKRMLGSAPTVTATEVAQTDVIAITATNADPAQAARIANKYAEAFVKNQQTVAVNSMTAAEAQLRAQIKSLGKEIQPLRGHSSEASQLTALVNQQAVLKEQSAQMEVDGTEAAGGLALVTPAQAPMSPSSPKPLQDGLLGLAAGLILGLIAGFIRDNLDDAVSSKEAAEQTSGTAVLTAIPTVGSWRRRDKPLVVSISGPSSPAAEAYRSLRTSLEFARQDRELQIILVTSPAATEGKTSTVANLGAAFARDGHRVVMV
jgi:polysaccharide biosynthesis transport protein